MERAEYLKSLAKAYERRGVHQPDADLAHADSELLIPVINAMCEAETRGYRRGIEAAKARVERDSMPSGWKHRAISAIGNG